jgi:hypothetical protein
VQAHFIASCAHQQLARQRRHARLSHGRPRQTLPNFFSHASKRPPATAPHARAATARSDCLGVCGGRGSWCPQGTTGAIFRSENESDGVMRFLHPSSAHERRRRLPANEWQLAVIHGNPFILWRSTMPGSLRLRTPCTRPRATPRSRATPQTRPGRPASRRAGVRRMARGARAPSGAP